MDENVARIRSMVADIEARATALLEAVRTLGEYPRYANLSETIWPTAFDCAVAALHILRYTNWKPSE